MIKIGSDQTGHSGVLTCVTDLPGLVTLTASDPGVTLTPSSFTVGGSVDSYCFSMGYVGAASTNQTLNKCRSLAIGFEIYFKSGVALSTGNTQAMYQNTLNSAGNWNFAINVNNSARKLGFYSTASGFLQFAKAHTANTWLRGVLQIGTTSITLTCDGATENINCTLVANPFVSTVTRTTYTGSGWQFKNLEFYDGIASAGQIASYQAGTKLAASSALLLDLVCQEESGKIFYDRSPTQADFTTESYNAASVYGQMLYDSAQRTITGITGNEQLVTYDTGSLAPGTAITITATRAKQGFPTGRTPDISVESDTCTVTAAAAPGLAVVGVALDEHAITLDIGGTHQLNETVFPSTATTKTVTWASSNTAVATVTAGLVTRVSGGTAVITVTTTDGGYTDTVNVTCVEDLSGTTPQAAKAWVVQTIKALRPTIRPSEHYDEYPKLLEGGDLPPGRSRIFALEEISADASRMVFGARMYGLRLYIGYLTQTTAKAAGQVNADIMASDIDFIKRSLEYRESWDTHIISVLCGQSVISGNDSGKGLAITVTDIEIHYLPIGV
jgi:hypothetical protein